MRARLVTMAAAVAVFAAACSKRPQPAIDITTDRAAPGWTVYAVQYARSQAVPTGELVVGGGDKPVDMSWHFYVLAGHGRLVAVDIGTDQFADKRSRVAKRWRIVQADTVARALSRVGLSATELSDVLLTHGHFDHADGIAAVPGARIHAHRETWDAMLSPKRRVRDSAAAVDAGGRRLELQTGAPAGLPGIETRVAGDHTAGHLVFVIQCRGGTRLAIAGDGAYLYENLERGLPITVARSRETNVADMAALVDELGAAAVVPGHDPAVFERFTRLAPGVARLCQ